mgnify:CR=1 FL=1
MAKILILHGPNLNMLGKREPQHYGSETLDSINAGLPALAVVNSGEVEIMQSTGGGVLGGRRRQVDGCGVWV